MPSNHSLLLDLGYSIFVKVRERIIADCDGVCVYCGVEVTLGPRGGGDRMATIDHKVPLSRGGTWKRYNLTCACHKCNTEKGAMTVEEYSAYLRAPKVADADLSETVG